LLHLDKGSAFNAYVDVKDSHRVAVLIPYFGASLPGWFHAFAMTALFSNAIFDWIIIATDIEDIIIYDNVKIIYRSREDIAKLLEGLDNTVPAQLAGNMTKVLLHLLNAYPYALVEFKPALGYLFDDLIRGYSHWAYADLDTIIGLAEAVITPNILSTYDLYTVSMGDQYRMYLRGQLTLHKNNAIVNNLWRKCKYLSSLGERLVEYAKQGKWSFQSAEGCYSRVAVDDKDLRVLVAPSLASEAFHGPLNEKEVLLLGKRVVRCYGHPLDGTDIDALRLFSEGTSHRRRDRSHLSLVQADLTFF
jgi:hypothetical protein